MLWELRKMEERYEGVLSVKREGCRVSEVAAKFGVRHMRVHTWLKRYEAGGLEALAEGSQRPKVSPAQMPAVIEARLLELRRHRPELGSGATAAPAAREGVEPLPSVSAMYTRADAQRSDRAGGEAQEAPDLQALGAGAADGTVADGRGGGRAPGKRHRVQDTHRHRRPLALHGLRRDHDPGDRAVRSVGTSARPWSVTECPRRSSPITARSSRTVSA